MKVTVGCGWLNADSRGSNADGRGACMKVTVGYGWLRLVADSMEYYNERKTIRKITIL